jgi:hypothetical protein
VSIPLRDFSLALLFLWRHCLYQAGDEAAVMKRLLKKTGSLKDRLYAIRESLSRHLGSAAKYTYSPRNLPIASHLTDNKGRGVDDGRHNLPRGTYRHHHVHSITLRPALEATMSIDPTLEPSRAELSAAEPSPVPRRDGLWQLQWSPIFVGALTATAVSSIMVTFGATLGLGVSSSAPTWRDASVALWVLSGLFLVLQSLISFGCGGYLAGRTRAAETALGHDDLERADGLHGVASWALAVVLGVFLTAIVAIAANHPSALTAPPSASEPSALSYEIDTLFRTTRHSPNVDITLLRAEAGRILLTSSSHNGVTTDDRAYLGQIVTATTGLTQSDADRRVDTVINDSRKAIFRARASGTILAFSVAAALLFGAVAAWAGAAAGGRHRDGMPLSGWMLHANRLGSRRSTWRRPTATP